jgi:O-antigen/teichoic acid export membrane protein/peptidoglycan/xylan/chitin deacetylase (PgdA/CDA1 family)
MTIAKKTIGISFATQYLELSIHFLGTLVLARLLSPEDIGVYSVAAFLMTLLHVFRDFGVVQYIIQEQDLTHEKIRSAMGVAIMLALAVAAVLYASSGAVARFYDNPAIEKVLVVMAASFAISPFGSLLIGILRREMELKKIFIIKMASALCHVTVAISCASIGLGALSLAFANFAGILVFGVGANLLRPKGLPWLPQFRNVKTVLSFGSISSLGSAANIAGTNMPDVIIGKVIDMAAVGYFSRANGVVQLFTKLVTSALTPLALPYFAQVRREGTDPAAPYLATVEYLTALAWPFFSTMLLLAYPLVRTLYGPQWDESVPIVELLCVAAAISAVSMFATQVMVANGQVRYSTYSQLIIQPIRVGATLVMARYGLEAIAVALVGSEFLALIVVSWYLRKSITIRPLALVRACGKSAVVACLSTIVPFLVKLHWDDSRPETWLPLFIGGAGAAAGWLAGIYLTKHPFMEHLKSMFQSIGWPKGTPVKHALKKLAYHTGLLDTYHRIRHRNVLTIAMFHRVLPKSDERHKGADPEWTMTPETFGHCLAFFRRHYNVVSPAQVAAALLDETSLPSRSLLVTFDDGWADTNEYARPLLEKFAISAQVFVAGSVLNQTEAFWEERLYCALATKPERLHALHAEALRRGLQFTLPQGAVLDESKIKSIIAELARHDRTAVLEFVENLGLPADGAPAMLNASQLAQLATSQSIGAHGMSHQPLTAAANVEEELQASMEVLSRHLQGQSVNAMSFPHGAYDADILTKCRSFGYRYLFSSDAFLNRLQGTREKDRPLGRIHISERAIVDRAGRFDPAMLATWLFLRPLGNLNDKGRSTNA